MTTVLDAIANLDILAQQVAYSHPVGVYLLFFGIVFFESTFLPVSPFLLGNGMVFSAGVLAAAGSVSLVSVLLVLTAAGVAGAGADYYVGKQFGLLLFSKFPNVDKKHLEQAQEFYQKHGNKAIWFSRFVTVARALVPLVAGMAGMEQRRFWNQILPSVSLWVLSFTLAGYFLGHIPVVKHYFIWIALGAVGLCLVTVLIYSMKNQLRRILAAVFPERQTPPK
jgi:membrane-associated protein